MPVGVPIAVALHLFACLVLQEQVWVVVSELAVETSARWLPPNSCARKTGRLRETMPSHLRRARLHGDRGPCAAMRLADW